MERSKLLKKIRRKQAQLRTNEPEMRVTFLDACSATLPAGDEVKYHVFVGNGGTRNGISRELLSTLLGGVDVLYMQESKDFSFATVTGQRKGPPLHLYLSLVDHIPASVLECNEDAVASGGHGPDLPPGLILIPDFISATEEEDLLSYFGTHYFTTSTFEDSHKQPFLGVPTDTAITDNTTTDKADVTEFVDVNPVIEGDGDPRTHVLSCTTTSSASQPISPPVASTLKHRTVSHYGYEFLYGTNTVDPAHPLLGGLPAICTPLLERLRSTRCLEWLPDQLTVNEYLPGAGIPPHIDTHSPFEDGIVSISLGSQVVMDFRHPDGRKVPVFLPRRSLLIMSGESRYLWTHGIAPRKTDEVHCNILGYAVSPSPTGHPLTCDPPHPHNTSTVIARGRRLSLTFRKVKRSPCSCRYPSQCDSQTA